MTDKNSSALLPTVANFPALKILLHMDDFVPGSLTFPARIGNFSAILTNTSGTKDADGYYATTAMSEQPFDTDAPLPIIGKGYLLAFGVGTARTGSGIAGYTGKFGDPLGASGGIGTNGLAMTDAAGTTNAIGSITVTTTGQKSAHTGYLDCVSASSPVMYRTIANQADAAVYQAANTMTAGTNWQGMDDTALDQKIEINTLITASDGGRGVMLGVLDLAAPLTSNELKLITIWLAFNQRTLPPLLRNRASA